MERRHFLQLFSLAPASVAAAETLVQPVNLPAGPGEIQLDPPRRTNPRASNPRACASIPPREPTYSTVLPNADYDLMHIPEGELVPDSWYFFTLPIGAPRQGVCSHCGMGTYNRFQGKTALETSQHRANSFPPPQTRSWDTLVFLFSPRMDEDDRLDLVMNFYFELRLADRIYARGPLARCPVMGELGDLVEVDGVDVLGNRRPVRKAVPLDAPFAIPFSQSIYLPPLQHFSLTLHGHSFVARKPIEVYAFLDGLAEFPTQ